MRPPRTTLLLGSALATLSVLPATRAASLASDNASNAAYAGNNWNTGDNGGTGFGSWTLVNQVNGGFAGNFIATAASNPDSNIGTGGGGQAFGQFANGTNFNSAVAFRPFTGSLGIGQTFSLQLDNGSVDPGNSLGFTLRTGNPAGSVANYNSNERFEFFFLGGGTNYQIVTSAGAVDTGIPFRSTGLTLSFTLIGADTADFMVRDAAGATLLGNFPNITLAGAGASTVDSFALYDREAGTQNVYFNNFNVVPEPSAGTLATAAGAILLGLCVWPRMRRAGY